MPTDRVRFPTPLAIRSYSTTDQPRLGSPYGWMEMGAAPLVDLNQLIPGIPTAGHIFAFTPMVATTANPAGQIMTHLLPSSGTCMFPGTTLTWVRVRW